MLYEDCRFLKDIDDEGVVFKLEIPFNNDVKSIDQSIKLVWCSRKIRYSLNMAT